MTAVTIPVTAEDIAFGFRRSACSCPIARALAREFPAAEAVSVIPRRATLRRADKHGSVCARIPLDNAATAFVLDYDAGRPVGPFDLTIDVPAEFLPDGAR